MTEYDFAQLNDKEFEALSLDLLRKKEGIDIERFKSGKDAGVDGRFFSSGNNEVIIQCKHWYRSGLGKLINMLEKTELGKVKKLKPERYILVLSLELSRKNKTKIMSIFAPYIRTASDILGKEDINDLIARNPVIERRHYKLWFCSINVLSHILNRDVVGNSQHKLEEIKKNLSLYAMTPDFEKAKNRLENSHTVIITGEPGVGKTTLSNQLALDYISQGFKFIYINESMVEAERLYQETTKQVFYFDDFLGRNYFLALQRNEDSRILNFIKRVRGNKYKRFILTSRTIILNRGKQVSELFNIDNLDKDKYEVQIENFSRFDKAQILYNHIWFSDLTKKMINVLYYDKRYIKVIDHQNYNPRLISFFTDSQKVSQLDDGSYWRYIEQSLANPSVIWEHMFNNQLESLSRRIIHLIVINGGVISESKLKMCFAKIREKNPPESDIDFLSLIKLLSKSFLDKIFGGSAKIIEYKISNPAIGDFIIGILENDIISCKHYYFYLQTISSLVHLSDLYENKLISKKMFLDILYFLTIEKELFRKLDPGKNIDYLVDLAYRALKESVVYHNEKIQQELELFLARIIFKQIRSSQIEKICYLFSWYLECRNDIVDSQVFFVYVSQLLTTCSDHGEYVALSTIIDRLPPSSKEQLSDKLYKAVILYWENQIDQYIVEVGILDDFYHDSDEDRAYTEISDYVYDQLSSYSFEFEDTDIQRICENCDILAIIEENREKALCDARFEDLQYSEWKENRNDFPDTDSKIHDLFER